MKILLFLLLLVPSLSFGFSSENTQPNTPTEKEDVDYFHKPNKPSHQQIDNQSEYPQDILQRNNQYSELIPGSNYRNEQSNFVGDKEYRFMTEWNVAINDYLYSQIVVNMAIKTYLNETNIISVTNLPIKDYTKKLIADNLTVNLIIDETAYKVNPLSPSEQAISRFSPTYWQWEVTPLKPGIHDIKLTFSAGILGNNNYISSLNYKMQVTASWWEKVQLWFEENKDGVTVSTILTILSAIGAYIKKKYFPKLKT